MPHVIPRYYVRAYALDKKLGLLPKGDVFALRRAMEGHNLAETELMGRVEHRD